MVYLSNDMREKMATNSRSYLIHQFQSTSASVVGKQVQVPLNFKHPVTCVFWRVTENDGTTDKAIFQQHSEIHQCQLSANGIDLTPWLDGKYFKYITNFQSFNRKELSDYGYHVCSYDSN